MMLMEKVEYVSGGPTSPLSITNIVHSGVVFFFLFADGRHCPTLGKCRQVQWREITCGNNIKRNAGIRMFPREQCQGLISCPSRLSGLPGLVGALAAAYGDSHGNNPFWCDLGGCEVFQLSAEISSDMLRDPTEA